MNIKISPLLATEGFKQGNNIGSSNVKKSELNNLKKRIKYANSHLNTTLGIETMNEFVPSVPVSVKNVRKISRELKKWQAEKKFKQKKENFAVRAYKYNELIPNNAFHFNAY